MADLDKRMRTLDEIGSPDLWSRIETWEPSAGNGGPGRGDGHVIRRAILAVTTLAVAGAAIGFAAVSFRGARPEQTPTPPAGSAPAPPVAVANGPLVIAAGSPSRIYVENMYGKGLHAISPPSLDASEPAVSRDGQTVAFVANASIYAMNADGSDVRRLTGGPAVAATHGESFPDGDPAWSPDGRRIAFVEVRPYPFASGVLGRCAYLFVMGADGSDRHAIARCTTLERPAWSPDGLAVATEGNLPGNATRGIVVMNADGSGPLSVPGSQEARAFAWSPDGQALAFPLGEGIVSIPSLGTVRNPRSLTSCGGSGCGPVPSLTFAPDGASLAFLSTARSGSVAVVVADRATGAVTHVPLPAGLVPTSVAWSPAAGTGRLAPPVDVVTSTARISNGSVDCSVATASAVEPGQQLPVRVVVHNVTGRTVAPNAEGRAVVDIREVNGRELWNENAAQGPVPRPYVPAPELLPGQGAQIFTPSPVVRWPGPLRVGVSCLDEPVPPMTVEVAVPGATPSTADAIAAAVSRLGGIFAACAPHEPDVWQPGTIDPGPGAARFSARCRAEVSAEDGFAVVRLQFVTPADAPPVTFGRYFASTEEHRPPGNHEDMTVAEWRLVVDQAGTTVAEGPDCIADSRHGSELSYFGLGGPVPRPGSCGD